RSLPAQAGIQYLTRSRLKEWVHACAGRATLTCNGTVGGIRHGQWEDNVALALGAAHGLSVWSQRAHWARIVDAAHDFGLRHLARDARLHHRRLHVVGQPRAGSPPRRAVDLERLSRDRGRHRVDFPDVARAARDVRQTPLPEGPADHLSALSLPRSLVDRL